MNLELAKQRGTPDPTSHFRRPSIAQRMVQEMHVNTRQGQQLPEAVVEASSVQVNGDVLLPTEAPVEAALGSLETSEADAVEIPTPVSKELVLAGPAKPEEPAATGDAVRTEEPKQQEIKLELKKAPTSAELSAMLFSSNSEVAGDLLKSDKPFAVALYKDGMYEKRENHIGRFIFRRALYEVPYCTQEIKEQFTMKMEKLPIGILKTTVAFFRAIMKSMHNNECMVQIFWDTQEKKYMIHIPEQYVAQASIKFIHDKDLQNDSRYIWVVDIHSHNTMQAFFSSGDDRDEKSTRIFGVIGSLQNEQFGHKWRAGCNGKYFDLNMGDLFDLFKEDVFEIKEEDLKKVKSASEMPDELRSSITSYGGSTYSTGSGYMGGHQSHHYSGPSGSGYYSGGGYAGHTPGAAHNYNADFHRSRHGGLTGTGRDFPSGGRTPSGPTVHYRPQYSAWGEQTGASPGKITKKQRKINRRLDKIISRSGGDAVLAFGGKGSGPSIGHPRQVPQHVQIPGLHTAAERRQAKNDNVGNYVEGSGLKGTNGTGLGDYDIVLNLNHINIGFDAFRSIKKTVTRFTERFKEGPGVLIDVDKVHETKFENGSQLLLEFLDVLVDEINRDIEFDLKDNIKYEESLGDIAINIAGIMSKMQTREKLVNVFASEMKLNAN